MLVLLGAVGCGAKTAKVTGTVTFNGQPLKGGNVTFARSDGKPSLTQPIQEDGSYSFDKVDVGTVKVCVETASLKPSGAPGGGGRGGAVPPANAPGGAAGPGGYTPGGNVGSMAARYMAIPPQYADTETTPLTLEVKPGSQNYNITLTK